MVRVLMLDLMRKQMQDKHLMTADVVIKINDELSKIVSPDYCDSVQSYLISRNGKKMKGTEHIWKYRLNSGDRILYSYGRYLPNIKSAESNTLVLLGYAKHDDQGFFAKSHRFELEKEYIDVEKYVRELRETTGTENVCELAPEDLYTIAELLTPAYLSKHAMYIVTGEMIADLSSDELDENPLLSEEQGTCVDEFLLDPKPTLILGGAGTGKTLVSVHILNNYSACDEQMEGAAYFTQSTELRSSIEHRYQVISEADDIPAMFFGINEYCIDTIEKNTDSQSTKLISYNHFEREIFSQLPESLSKQCAKYGIDQLAAWTEIRGIIKGQLDHEWRRTNPLSQNDFPRGTAISELIKQGWFIRYPKDPTKLMLTMSVEKTKERLKKAVELDETSQKAIKFATDYFSGVDAKIPDIGKDAYLSLSAENTTLSQDQRKILWKVYEEHYSKYLIKNGYLDDNDLARHTLSLLKEKPDCVQKFGLVVVDEIQDYTELQIFLLHSLSANGRHIIFAGDANQNVNPSLFREEKLKRLYSVPNRDSTALKIVYLTGNYRCPKETVRVTNALSDVRRKVIAKGKDEREQDETSGREGTQPYRLVCSDANIRGILAEMMQYPRTAFLVPDEMSKDKIISMIGKEKYKSNGVPFVHTVAEIKGMEYAYVVCFNLFGQYISTWNSILSPEHKKKNTGERYFFNLPYVAMTRTQQHLCVIDCALNPILEETLSLPAVTDFDPEALYFNTLEKDSSAWIKAAKESEEKGHYRDAVDLYVKAGASFKDIRRCKAKLYAEENSYPLAVQNAFVAGDMSCIRNYENRLTDNDLEKKLIHSILYLNNAGNGGMKTSELVDRTFATNGAEYTSEEITQVRLFCIKCINELLHRYMDQADEWLSEYDEEGEELS